MALIIHKVLFEKLGNHPEWVQFRETFGTLSGHAVGLVEAVPEQKEKQVWASVDVRGVLVGVLVAEVGGGQPAHAAACQHLLAMAAERFASILAESHSHDHERLPAVVLRTCRWIRSRALTHEVRLAEAAAECGLSPSYLSRVFHQSTGVTFQEYVSRFRLERACELLSTTSQSVTAIAFESGFQSISQFHRAFKAVYREPPLNYRKQHT